MPDAALEDEAAQDRARAVGQADVELAQAPVAEPGGGTV